MRPKDKTKPVAPRLTAHAKTVLTRRYLQPGNGHRPPETPAGMFRRVADTVASADLRYGSARAAEKSARLFYEAMARLDFLPNSPALMNAGRELGQLSACFVLPVEDSIESIFNAVRDTALIHKSGGGTGFSFSSLRPANDLVQSTRGVSSGPVSFMNVFDVTTETIKQGGVRRGANMGLLSVHHPDVREFIRTKSDKPGRFGNFNLSVSVTEAFMASFLRDETYDLVNPHTGRVTERPKAREIFDLIVESAWACGDPGLVFIDRINESNPLPGLGAIEATNPCGEQPLLPYESCILGSVNLSRFVRRSRIDYGRLGPVVRLGVHFLDNSLDVNRYPLEEIAEISRRNRKIGLGVMGLADALIRLGLPYDSDEALTVCGRLMEFIQSEARAASADLARTRGNFASFEGSRHQAAGRRHMRNATTTTIAPTGSLSIIAGCSSGIEPLYALAYRRRVLDGRELVEFHSGFKRLARARGFWSEALARRLEKIGSIKNDPDAPDDVRRLYVTAHDLEPVWHLKIQAAFQDHTDNAVSKTINLPADASKEAVREIFLRAYELRLKGVTVYRDGSKADQVLRFGSPYNGLAGGPCPECGSVMSPDQGCWTCRDCGFSCCY